MHRPGDPTFCSTDILTIGFGTAASMWAVAYLCRMPGAFVPGWMLGATLLLLILAGGVLAGRLTGRGVWGGLQVGFVVGTINLLVLGSLVSGDAPGSVVPSALWWLPGSFLLTMGLSCLGALLAGRQAGPVPAAPWPHRFALMACLSTLFLIAVGGLVTGHRAGLAVVDWPNSYGYNMFLYPLSRMTGGIFYEHAHRLFGSLIGLTTLVLFVQLVRTEARRWVKGLGGVALVLVIGQGILGGLRVTGQFTLTTNPAEVAPNLGLALVHGVVAQCFLGVLVGLAVVTSPAWRQQRATGRPAGTTDRILAAGLVGVLLIQLLLGATVRHFDQLILLHILVGGLALALAITCGLRSWGVYGTTHRPLLLMGKALLVLAPLQVLLGLGAFVGRGMSATWLRVGSTTLHQTTGALLLACAVAHALFVFRRLAAQPVGPATPSQPALMGAAATGPCP